MAYFTASCDEPAFNKEFATELGLDYPILSDPSREVAKAYGLVKDAKGFPSRVTFYIGKDGKLLFIDKQINTAEAGKDMVAKLAELGVEKKTKKSE